MSKVEVNQVTQQCGTTLTVGGGACKTAVVDATTVTLGRCGGTVSLASGATQSGFGRTGTVDWITTPKVTGDSPVTGDTGKGYFLNTTAGVITLNLPVGTAGDIISMADYAGTWHTYHVTVTPNGSEKIGGTNASVILNTQGQSVTLVYADAVQGWLNTMDSTSNVRGSAFISATVSGACNTLVTAPDCADTKIATFLNPGTFCVGSAASSAANNVVSYLVVGGGGGSGPGAPAGGGGAGGFREYKSPVTPYTASPLDGNPGGTEITVAASPYTIAVGGGGTPAPLPLADASGDNSTFSTIVAAGGGAANGSMDYAAQPGGSGGGSGGADSGGVTSAGGNGNDPSVSPAQGFPGGSQLSGPNTSNTRGGGGGGATVAGATGPVSGSGGAGATTSISATPTTYAGGGGAGSENYSAGAAGPGGGGAGGQYPSCSGSANGTVNTGGGSGQGYSAKKNGGSGIVIIRYKFQ